ncbi:hypothetical protein [Algisphaera agarilytica]|uniref:Uncharacterized protein n=1 Tax=Algisphaera agarilytica TaxID=1385975 RepID=A0A7X0H4A5_9BACT|nr:hypothetical protein [Algisphaera agarilytica]MBB6429038.1 hypothetical protein [Algisphaera agarilytica]
MPKTKNKKRKAKQTKPLKLSAARTVAAEDLRVGDGVTVAYVTLQVLASEDPPPGETHNRVLKADYIPHDAGDPLRIVGVCLPFVLAENAYKRHVTLDVRRQHLVKLDSAYTRRALKKLGRKKR